MRGNVPYQKSKIHQSKQHGIATYCREYSPETDPYVCKNSEYPKVSIQIHREIMGYLIIAVELNG